MHNGSRALLITLGTIAAGIAAGFAITRSFTKHTEKKIGGKLMHVHYRFSRDFDV